MNKSLVNFFILELLIRYFPRPNRVSFIAIIFIFFFYSFANAQNPQIVFKRYDTDSGLSASIVRCVIQDKTGYLWFGTYSGLDRYDGSKFKSYKNIPGDSLSITNGFVQCLIEDKNGNLWIGTSNGLDKFDHSTETFSHFYPFEKVGVNEWNNNIFSIQEDQNGLLWIGTGDGLCLFDPSTEKFTHFIHDRLDSTSISHNVILSILLDRSGCLWIGTGNGLDKYNRERGTFINYWGNSVELEGYYDGGIHNKYRVEALFEDDENTLWICTKDGLLELNSDRNKFTLYEHDSKNASTVSYYATSSICEENQNALWIGTWNGLNLFDKRTKKFTRYYHKDKELTSLSHNSISGVLRERSGTLWVTTYGGGVNKVNRTTYPFKQYPEQLWKRTDQFSSASIMSMDKAKDGSIWLSTPTGLMNFDPILENFRYNKITKNIRFVKEDGKGNLWLSMNHSAGRGLIKYEKSGRTINVTDSSGNKILWLINKIVEYNDSTFWACTSDMGGIIKINTFTNKFKIVYSSATTINTIYCDKDGLIWAGTRENGLLCFDPLQNKIINHFLSEPRNPRSISGNSIIKIFEDQKDNFWLGTNMGLNKFDRVKKTFKNYTETDGLPHNWIYLIFEDGKNNLWISTLKGISKFNPRTEVFNNYDVLYGLVAADRNGVGCQTDEGEIYLDSPAGLTRFHPDSIRDNPYIPQIVITNVSISGSSVNIVEEMTLNYFENNLSFEFAALSYIRPEKNKYAYWLEGKDENWVYAGTQRYASYMNLEPGEYTFRVKGSNNDGIWNEEGASIR